MRAWIRLALGATLLTACGGAGAEHAATTSSSGAGSAGSGGAVGAATSSSSAATTGSGGAHPDGGPEQPDAGPKPPDAGGSSDVTVYVTPNTSLQGQIVAAIEGATASVHMTMYILDNDAIVQALVNRAHAGLDVRVIMNQTFPSGTTESNPTTYTTLEAAGAKVVWRNGPPGAASGAYTHEKAFVIDGKQAWIMTMNLDQTAPKYNREYVVVDDAAADVQETDKIFLADFAGTAETWGSPLVVSPDPPCNSRAALVALINSATTTLDIEAEEFSDNYSGVTAAVVDAAKNRHVATRLILAQGTPTTAQVTSVDAARAAGVKIVVSGGTSGGSTASSPYIHAKAITVDCAGTVCARAYLGSENFSAGSLGYNRELGVIVDDPTEIAKVEAAIDADFTAGTSASY